MRPEGPARAGPALTLPGAREAEGSRLETLSDAVARLTRAGYADSFQALNGTLVSLSDGRSHAPEGLCVAEIVRFEGESDSGDSAVLFALSSHDGCTRGTLVAGYGASSDAETASAMRRLDASHADGERARARRAPRRS